MNRIIPAVPFIVQCVLALVVLASSPLAGAQQEVPEVISPLRIEEDHNGVNTISGKTQLPVPALSVPAAPNLRFDRVQYAAPYVSGETWEVGGEPAESNFSVHTIAGTSESFKCQQLECVSVLGSGSVFVTSPGSSSYWRGGSGERYEFDRRHVKTTGTSPVYMLYYASSVTYPNGEVITFAYDTAILTGVQPERTLHRPIRVTSNLGFFITISYHSNDIQNSGWGFPAVAALYSNAAPTTPLGSLTYSQDGSTITDLGGRVFTCQNCARTVGAALEQISGSFTLPGDASPTVDAAPGSSLLVGSVTRDGVPWNYAYTNVFYSPQGGGYLYSKVTVTGPNGYNTVYDIETNNHRNVIKRVTDSIGRATEFDHDNRYRLTRVAYPEGNEVSIIYDSVGNVTSRTTQPKPGSSLSPISESAHFPTASCNYYTFDILCNRPSWYRDALGRQTDFQYNANGQLTEQTDPADASGVRRRTLITYETSTGLSRRSVVRVCGDTSTCNTPNEIRTEYEYWGNTFLPSVERRIDAARGVTLETHYTYDLAGRLLVEDSPLPGTDDAAYYRYDVLGRRTWEIGPLGANGRRNAREFEYRAADDKVLRIKQGTVSNPMSSVLAEHTRTDFGYDPRRNPVTEAVSSAGITYGLIQRAFDDRGRLVCEARRMYPAAFGSSPGACTLGSQGTFGPDRITRQLYDTASQLLQVQRAYGTALQQNYASYTYSANGQRTSITDANGNRAELRYDGHDRQSRWVFPSKTTPGALNESDYEAYGHDAAGNRISLRKRDGKTISYQYDGRNRVTVKTVPASASGTAGYSVFYGYDVQGLQLYARFGSSSGAGITNGYDGFGRLLSSTSTLGGVSRTLTSGYDAGSRRTRLTFPDGQYFTYEHDPAGRLTAIRENGATAVASFTQDAQGRRASASLGGAATSYGYDALSRLSGLSHDLAGTAVDQSLTFAYSPAAQIISRSSSNAAYAPSPAPTLIRNYSINGLNQYTSIGGTAHVYDLNGNLTSGNLTPEGVTHFVYDTENRMVSASGAKNASLSYDPLGRLYQVAGGANVTQFLYDGDKLVAEYDGSGNLKRRYVHGAGIDEPLLWYEGSGLGTRRGLLADHQGSIIAVTTPTGSAHAINAYDAWGIPNPDNDGRFQYTGQAWLPELGLYHYKARVYAPHLGRFLQTDPIGYDDQMNLYAYVGNDPLSKTDPTGEMGVPGALYGGIAGGVGGFVASGDSFREKLVGTISGAVAGGSVGLIAPQTSGFVGMTVAGALASATGQAIGSTANAAIAKGVENVSRSDVNIDASTTIAGGLGAGAGGLVARGIASTTSQPIVGNTIQAAGTPTSAGLAAGAVAQGATIGAAEKLAPTVVDAVQERVQDIKRESLRQ